MIKTLYVENVKNEEISGNYKSNNVILASNLNAEDYEILSQKLNIKKQRLKDTVNEEVFTPRMVKSDWSIYKVYYPKINTQKEDKSSFNMRIKAEIIPIIILYREEQIVILEEKYTQELETFIISYLESQSNYIDNRNLLLVLFHHTVQNLYKHVRFLMSEHDMLEDLLQTSKNNDKLIDLVEIEQGFAIFNLALRNINFIIDNLYEIEDFSNYLDYLTRIQQEISFTADLSSTHVEICKTTRETYSSYIANDMNVTMKILAVVTILVTIPNAVFGFYGMNVKLPFQDKGYFTLIFIFIIIIIGIWGVRKYLKNKKMF